MKNVFFAALMMAGLMMAPVAAHAEAASVGIVDVNYVMAESEAGKSLQKQIKDQTTALQGEFSKIERELKDMEAAVVKARNDKVSEEEFKKKAEAYQKKMTDSQALFQKKTGEFEKAKAEALKALSEAILKETDRVAAEKKVSLVLSKNVVILSSKEMDITQSVFEGVNKNLKDVKLKTGTN